MCLDMSLQYHIDTNFGNKNLVNKNYFGGRFIQTYSKLSQDISSPLGQFTGGVVFDIIILTVVITIVLYLDEIIKYICMHNSFISIMNFNFCWRVSCNLIQCVKHTGMYTPNFIQYLSGLMNLTSSIMHFQLFSHSIHYISFLKILCPLITSGTDIISTWGGIPINKGVSAVLLHGKQTTQYFIISEFSAEINKGYLLIFIVKRIILLSK